MRDRGGVRPRPANRERRFGPLALDRKPSACAGPSEHANAKGPRGHPRGPARNGRLPHYSDFAGPMAIFRGLATSLLGHVTDSTPLASFASTFSASTAEGRVSRCSKRP